MKRFLGILVILLTSWNFTFAAIDYSVGGITLNEILKTPLDSVKVVLMKNGMKLDSTYSSMRKVNGKMRAYFEFEKIQQDDTRHLSMPFLTQGLRIY